MEKEINEFIRMDNPICKHIAKAPQANASIIALSKSLQMPARLAHRAFGFAYAQKTK